MLITLQFSFQESEDQKAPVTIPESCLPLIPVPGDLVTIRSGHLRPVVTRHFSYGQDSITVTIVCK